MATQDSGLRTRTNDRVRTRLDLTTFLFYLSKITSNLPENYSSESKTTS